MQPRLPKFPFKKPIETTPPEKIHCGLCKEGKHPDGAPSIKGSMLENKEGFYYKYWKYYTKKR